MRSFFRRSELAKVTSNPNLKVNSVLERFHTLPDIMFSEKCCPELDGLFKRPINGVKYSVYYFLHNIVPRERDTKKTKEHN